MVEFKIDLKVRRHWRYHIALFLWPVLKHIPGLRHLCKLAAYSGVSLSLPGRKPRRLRYRDRVAP